MLTIRGGLAESLADTLKGYLDNPETLLPIDILVRPQRNNIVHAGGLS